MGAVVSAAEVERVRERRARECAANESHRIEGGSHFDRLQRQFLASGGRFEAPRDSDEFASLLCMFEGDPGRQSTDFLRECEKVQRANVGLLICLMAAATAIASNILKNTADLLHRASVLAAEKHSGSKGDAWVRRDGAGLR